MNFMAAADRLSRRGFLQGRAAISALTDAVVRHGSDGDATSIDSPEPQKSAAPLQHPGRSDPLVSVRRRAMACEFEVQLAAGGDVQDTDSVLDALDLVESLEDQLTVYRDDSEIIRLNQRAADEAVLVERRMFALLELAARLHRETGGAVDLTSGPLSDVWGFSQRQGRMPNDAEISQALARVGMDHVQFDAERCAIRYRKPGVTVNVNCIGKGYALDRMAELLDANGVQNYLLHGGRSSVLARGSCPGGGRTGWTIGMRHPLRPDVRLAEFHLQNKALGTSGSGTQFFEHAGHRYGHLLDPRTGLPVSGLYTSTVIASTAAEADALSTAFYVMAPVEVEAFCAKRPDIAAFLVRAVEGNGEEIETQAIGLDGSCWTPAF